MAETGVKPYLFHLQPNCFLVVVVYVIPNRKQGRHQWKRTKAPHKVFQGAFRSKYLIILKKPRESSKISHHVDKNFPSVHILRCI